MSVQFSYSLLLEEKRVFRSIQDQVNLNAVFLGHRAVLDKLVDRVFFENVFDRNQKMSAFTKKEALIKSNAEILYLASTVFSYLSRAVMEYMTQLSGIFKQEPSLALCEKDADTLPEVFKKVCPTAFKIAVVGGRILEKYTLPCVSVHKHGEEIKSACALLTSEGYISDLIRNSPFLTESGRAQVRQNFDFVKQLVANALQNIPQFGSYFEDCKKAYQDFLGSQKMNQEDLFSYIAAQVYSSRSTFIGQVAECCMLLRHATGERSLEMSFNWVTLLGLEQKERFDTKCKQLGLDLTERHMFF